MEDEELFIAERLDVYLLVSAADEGAQFVAQHLGIATSDDDVGVWFGTETSDASLKLRDVLYLVDEDIVVFASNEVLIYVLVEVLIVSDTVKFSFLLINIDDVVVRVASLLVTNGLHHVAFANTTLSHQYDDSFLPKVFLYLINVCLYFPEKGCHLGTNRSDNET